jgi:hypothetical protein
MPDVSTRRMGGAGALLVAACTVTFAALVLLAPQEALEPDQVSWPHVLADYALALTGLFGLAVVPAVTDRVVHLNAGLVRWTSHIAMLGFGVLAVLSFWQAEYEIVPTESAYSLPTVAYDVPQASPAAAWETAWEDLKVRTPRGWLEVAGVGLWILTVSWLCRQRRTLPAGMTGLGIVVGVFAFYMALGATLQIPSLVALGVVSSLLLTPLWFAWMGIVLIQEAHVEARAAAPGLASAPLRPATRRIFRPWDHSQLQRRFWPARRGEHVKPGGSVDELPDVVR